MTATMHTGWSLTDAQVALLAVVAGADTLTEVLGTAPVSRAERAGARAGLREQGLVVDEGADPDLTRALRGLADPALEVSMRSAPAGLRAVLAVDTTSQVLAVRTHGRVTVSRVWAADVQGAARRLGEVLDRALGSFVAADIASAQFPLGPLSERLAACRDAHDVAAALAGGGMTATDASRLADAVTSARHRTEIVARVRASGLPITSVGAIAVLDGPAGRVIAGPDLSIDGTPWTTFSPGTALRLEQALGRLVATLPGEGVPWGPPRGEVA